MKTRVASPSRHTTSTGRTIYGVCTEVFPGFFGNQYLLDDGNGLVLIDTGSASPSSHENLSAALASLDDQFGLTVKLSELRAILITHGHMDHFGGLGFVRSQSTAPVAIHPLDQRVLTHYEERVVQTAHALRRFLAQAGLDEEARAQLMNMYEFPKRLHSSTTVEFSLEEGKPVLAPQADGTLVDLDLEVFHTPGHCPGQVCLRVDDVLLSADHVLERITPHQSPESVTLHTGLWHYLESLDKVARIPGISLALGGHENPVQDLAGRALAIRASHQRRLDKVMQLCREPRSIAEVSRGLFGALKGYNTLLGLEEAGAHVEYLEQMGSLGMSNLTEVQHSASTAPLYLAR
jgi:glyoxylase-like metal-dependent hydrolase (beta-lactamase superfamily II)